MLPGGRVIQEWVERGLAEDRDGGLTVIFTDLDRFKEYNDVYGLLMGDDLVRRTPRTRPAPFSTASSSARAAA